MERKKTPTICVEFQGNEYSIPGEPRAFIDYVEHEIECPSCKDAYWTYESAMKALRQRTGREERNKRIYRCEFCVCYHFTTNDGYTHHRRHYDRTDSQTRLRRAVASVSEADMRSVRETLSRPGSLRIFVNAQNLRNSDAVLRIGVRQYRY